MDRIYLFLQQIKNKMKQYQFINEDNTPKSAWDSLSIAEKSEMIGVAVKNGITDLPTIRQKYNEFAEGGNLYQSGGGIKGGKKKGDKVDTTQCAAWSNGLLRENGYMPYGNAWALGNVDMLFNGFDSIPRPESFDKTAVERYNHAASDNVYRNFDSKTLDKNKPYVVNMFYNDSPALEDAYNQGKGVTGTHTGVLTWEEPANRWMVTHNVHGTIHQEPFGKLQNGNNQYGVTAVYAPRKENAWNKVRGFFGFAEGGGIHIKPENRGKFTALKERTGHSATWFKEHGTPAQKKMATFALNARKWKHSLGGPLVEVAMSHQYGWGDYLRKGVDWLGNALQIGAIAENPSVMTAAGWRVNNGRAVQDRQVAPETQQLRENLVAIGDAALTAPTLASDLEALYRGGKQVVLHPIQSARAAKEAVVEGARAAKESIRKGVDAVRQRIYRTPAEEWAEAATPASITPNARPLVAEENPWITTNANDILQHPSTSRRFQIYKDVYEEEVPEGVKQIYRNAVLPRLQKAHSDYLPLQELIQDNVEKALSRDYTVYPERVFNDAGQNNVAGITFPDGHIAIREGNEDLAVGHEVRHRLQQYSEPQTMQELKVLNDAYDSNFVTLGREYPELKGLNLDLERETLNYDARRSLVGDNVLKQFDLDTQNAIIDDMSDIDVFNAVEEANGYGSAYIDFLRKNNLLTHKKAQQFKEAMKHVGAYAAPVGIGLGTLYGEQE